MEAAAAAALEGAAVMVARVGTTAAVVATLAVVATEDCADTARAKERRVTIEAIVEKRREEGRMDCFDAGSTIVRRRAQVSIVCRCFTYEKTQQSTAG